MLEAPITADIASIPFRGIVKINASDWISSAHISLNAQQAPLGPLVSWLSGFDKTSGHLDTGELIISTHGTKLTEWLNNGQLSFTVKNAFAQWGEQASFVVEKALITAGLLEDTLIDIKGDLIGIPAQLTIHGGSLNAIINQAPWYTNMRFNSPAFNLTAEGELLAGQWQNGSWLDLSASSDNMQSMHRWLGTHPDTFGPLRI